MSDEKLIFDGNALTFSKPWGSVFSIETPQPMNFGSYLTQQEGAIFKKRDEISSERWFIPGAISFTGGTPNEGKHCAFVSGMRRYVENSEFYRIIAADTFAACAKVSFSPFAMLLLSPAQAYLRLGSVTIWAGFHSPHGKITTNEKNFDWLMQPDAAIKNKLTPWAETTDWALLFHWLEWSERRQFWSCVQTQRQFSVSEIQTSVHHLAILLAALTTKEASVCLFGDENANRAGWSNLNPGSTLLQNDLREAWTELTVWLFERTGTRFYPDLCKSARRDSHRFKRVFPAKLQWTLSLSSEHQAVEAALHWNYLLDNLKAPKTTRNTFAELIMCGQKGREANT